MNLVMVAKTYISLTRHKFRNAISSLANRTEVSARARAKSANSLPASILLHYIE